MALSAGLTINPECIDAYKKFKLDKNHEFVIFKANSATTQIVVDVSPSIGESAASFEKHSSSFPREGDEPLEYWNMRRLMLESKEPRYATIMIPDRNGKLALIVWQPQDAGMKKNMVYSSTKFTLKAKLEGIQLMPQCNDLEELSFAEVSKQTSKI